MEKEKIRSLDDVIKEIENCNYIDCHKDEIFDNYLYENILYYLKKLEKQKEIIDRLKELNLTISDSDYIYSQDEITSKNLELLQILEDKEV